MGAHQDRPYLHIAVGIVADENGRILVTRRQRGQHGAGFWEFPGGKVEPGEKLTQALSRELHEELALVVHASEPLIRLEYDYPDRRVLLDTCRVTRWDGPPRAMEGQPMLWCEADALKSVGLLPANRPIITAINLPSAYLITPDFSHTKDFLSQLQMSLRSGIRLLRLRCPSLDDTAYESLAADVLALCRAAGARLLLDRHADMVLRTGADGLHLSSTKARRIRRRPIPSQFLLAGSAHTREDLNQLCEIGCCFAVLSPVRSSLGHGPVMGWRRFANLTRTMNMPVYGLGGLGPEHLIQARSAGAQGIAGISHLWGRQTHT